MITQRDLEAIDDDQAFAPLPVIQRAACDWCGLLAVGTLLLLAVML